MNQVDATYRSELRELFEVHFGRFDARLEQRTAHLDAKLEQRLAELKGDLRTEIATSRAEALRWNFLFWIGTVGAVMALLKL